MKKIFLLIWVLSACSQADKQAGSNQLIDAVQFKERISEGTVLIDVRTPEELSTGIIANAINIDFKADDFAQRLDSLDKTQTYLLYCASGVRSGKAADLMRTKGFENVVALDGGVNAWVEAGFALE